MGSPTINRRAGMGGVSGFQNGLRSGDNIGGQAWTMFESKNRS